MKLTIIATLFAIGLVSCNDIVKSPYPDIVLNKENDFPGVGRSTATSFVVNNKAYILFGRPDIYNSKGLTDCWEYNPANNSWLQKVDFPGKGRVGAIAEVVNNKAYIGFGYYSGFGVYSSDTTILSDFWMFDPLQNKWEQKSDFPKNAYTNKPPLNSCSSFVYQKWIYIIGLYDGKSYQNEVWRYNTETDKWEKMKDFPGSPRSAAVACTDGIFYYFGLGYNMTYRSDWWQYFPATDSWKEMKSIPGKGRVNATAFSVNNRFFVVGGHYISGTLTGDEYFDTFLEYDRAVNKWYIIGKLPTGGRENAISYTLDHKAYISCGESSDKVYNDVWSFTP